MVSLGFDSDVCTVIGCKFGAFVHSVVCAQWGLGGYGADVQYSAFMQYESINKVLQMQLVGS